MAVTITIEEPMSFGDVRAVYFKAVTTTSTANAVTAAALGLGNILSLSPAGGDGTLTWSGTARATTGNLISFSGVTASSGTVYGLAVGY